MGVVRACVETLPGTDGGGIPEAWRTVFRTGVKVSAIPSECCPPWARNAVRHQIGKVSGMGRNAQRCRIGMEACGSAHHFARELTQLGHDVRLIPPQHVKAYLRGQKNDLNDARAIAEAVRAPGMRFAAIKTTAQQDLQSLVRLREGAVQSRTALVNRLRGLLGEYGIVVARGVATLRRALPEVLEAADNGLSDALRRWLNEWRQQLLGLDAHIDALTAELTLAAEGDERVKRLQTVPG